MIQNHNLPIQVLMSSMSTIKKHWHNSVEVLLVLEGQLKITKKDQETFVSTNDLVIINSQELYSIETISETNNVLSIQLSNDLFMALGINVSETYYVINQQEVVLKEVKSIMAEMMLMTLRQEKHYNVKVGQKALRLIYLLELYFKVSFELDIHQSEVQSLSLAISEIQKNYDKNITLEDVATVQGFSRNYFSQYFKDQMGITFSQYLTSVRLDHAFQQLINTEDAITDIAYDNGFPNTKSFSKSFKETFKQSPFQYRKSYFENLEEHKPSSTPEAFGSPRFKFLKDYILKDETALKLPAATQTLSKTIDTQQKGEPVNKSATKLLTFGRASSALQTSLQKQLEKAQRDIGFTHVRFHGLLDDDMAVYTEDDDGTPSFNFFYINQLVDYLLSINLKPWIEFTFMPSKLAKNKYVVWNKSYISMPKDVKKWNSLIHAILENFSQRYGSDEVRQWKFELWSEPEFINVMWNDSVEDYLELWKETYQTVKAFDSKIQIGGPGTYIKTIFEDQWFPHYAKFIKETNTQPDFLSVHFYPMKGLRHAVFKENDIKQEDVDYDLINSQFKELTKQVGITLSNNPDELNEQFQLMKDALETYDLNHLDIYLTEWNHSPWQRDLIHDTAFKSAYLTKNIVDNMNNFKSFGYWSLSDLMAEVAIQNKLFHGGFGLMTTNNIPKAGYYAMQLLSKLGSHLIERGDHYAVYKDGDKIQVIFHHYSHINALYQHFDGTDISDTDRYNVFQDSHNLDIDVTLKMSDLGNYKIKNTYVGRDSGSAYDTWNDMGAPEHLTHEEHMNLDRLSHPKTFIRFEKNTDIISIHEALNAQDVILIEIEKTS